MKKPRRKEKKQSERKRNKDRTLVWDSNAHEGEFLIGLLTMNQTDPNEGADPHNVKPDYIRRVYENNSYFSDPGKFSLRAFREAYKRMAVAFIAEQNGREHQRK